MQLELEKINFPHSLTFLEVTWCDVCGTDKSRQSTYTCIIEVNRGIIGWQHCNSESCRETIENWKKVHLISKENIINELGTKTVRVKRSSGNFCTDWTICSDSFNSFGTFIVCVEDSINSLKKFVSLKKLKKWNCIS
jgi:hypothetical protein